MARKIILITVGIALGVFAFAVKEHLPKELLSQPANSRQNDDDLKMKIGQMIMVGFRGTEAKDNSFIAKAIKETNLGGVVLFDIDVPTKSFPRNIVNPEQTKKLISDLKKYSMEPLLVAVDAEGGEVNRLKEDYGFLSSLSAQEMGKDLALATTQKEAEKLAKELADLGFNLNFAPVVDVNINPQNPIIGSLGRSFSGDPQIVANNAKVFAETLLKYGVIPVAKHFPGHGSSSQDSHLKSVDVTDTYQEEKELLPYYRLQKQGLLKAVMTAHIINKKVDDNPATLSFKWLNDILRKEIGFEGVIFSDDMQMGAIAGTKEAIVTAINAGCDIVAFSNNSPNGYDELLPYKISDIIFQAVKENKISEERIDESLKRIQALKKSL